jgi:hypothetical protein
MKPELQHDMNLQPFPTLPMTSPLAPPADHGDAAPC